MQTTYTYANRQAWRKQASLNRKAKRLAFTLKALAGVALLYGFTYTGMGWLLSVAPLG
jgi:hypothetical protein